MVTFLTTIALAIQSSFFSTDFVLTVCFIVWQYLQPLFGPFQRLLPWWRSPTRVVDAEAQCPDQTLDVLPTSKCLVKLELLDTPTSSLEAPSIMWLLETSTDPEVFLAAASLVPHVDWPLDLDLSDTLHQLYDVYTSCLDIQGRIVPSLEEKALACTMALCHLYCNIILQGNPTYGSLSEGRTDYDVFYEMFKRTKVNDKVLVAIIKLVIAENGSPSWWASPRFGTCPDSVLEWLSHVLPFHFVIGQVDKEVEKLAATVISKLLCSNSSPSPQIIANCTLLACVMVGVQFDKKDIVRVDKRCY
ncbi:hypothetical protein EDD22DRAFT_947616 [Suillus occidentalis]|nr:hypothetical protein EDD22DRAFT_947616 [Suillus occidentalis]